MRTTKPIASSLFTLAVLLSVPARAQTPAPRGATPATPTTQQAQPAPVAQQAPPAYAPSTSVPAAQQAPPAYAPTTPASAAPPAPAYRPLQPAPQVVAPMAPQPYPAYDPSTGQMVMVTPFAPAQRMPPKELPYTEGRPIPPGYAVDEYHPRGLIIGGAVTLGALWAISFSVASSNDFSGANGWLAVPVIGPFGWLATREAPQCNESSYSYTNCNSNESSNRTLVAFDGIGQVAGAAMLVAGLAITRKHLVLVDPQAAFSVTPYATSRGSGLQLIGRF